MGIETTFVHPIIATWCSEIWVKPSGIIETRNVKFNRRFCEAHTEQCLVFQELLCSRIYLKHCCTKCVWYSTVLFQTAHFSNKCQVNLFLFQWFSPVFLSSSSPKVCICSNRSNLHISSFLKFELVLRIIDKHCNKIIEPSSNKYVGHKPAIC